MADLRKEALSFSFYSETGKLYSRTVPKLAPNYIEI